MSLESLGSLARTVSDRFLRENLRRIITGTNSSISSVLDGFRGQSSETAGKDCTEPLQHGEPQPGPSAFDDFARGGSYARQTSDTMLKRRNSSVGRRAPGQQPLGRELHTIYSATSLRCPTSPRAQKKPSHSQQPQGQRSSKWRWSRILTAAVFTAWAILGVCFLLGTWLPHHSADLAQGVQSPAASWRLLSMLRTSNPRHLLEEGSGAPLHVGTAHHRHGEDAFSAAAKRVKHQEHASRWGQHMAGRMSRALAEGDATGEGAAATAEAPGIAVSTLSSVRSSATGQSSSNSNAAGEMSAAERAAAAGAVSGGGSGASVGGAAFGGVSLLQQDASAEVTVQNTAAGAGANTLQYSNGYVNVTGPYYRMVQHTQNHGVCAAACAADAPCTAWTRVAAGRPDVQACYLRSSNPSDRNTFFTTAVQYVAPSQASQVVLESGTKSPDALPAALYGCPYPPSRNGGCRPPPTCNCYQGVCYGDC